MNTRDKCLGTLVRENRTRHAERERERERGGWMIARWSEASPAEYSRLISYAGKLI